MFQASWEAVTETETVDISIVELSFERPILHFARKEQLEKLSSS